MCRVLQPIVWLGQSIVRDGNRVRRVHGEAARKVTVILLIFTVYLSSSIILNNATRETRTHERQAPPCKKQMSGAGGCCGCRWETNKSKVCKELGVVSSM